MARIVAFGGSAGSFQIFREILPALPRNLGVAYVYLTHLPRTHVSKIPSLFAKSTSMEVFCADQPRPVQPNTLYVLAPHTFLFLRKRGLRPEPRPPNSPNRAVDHFFTSLAESLGPRAVGIVLSGAGSDGRRGCVEIRARGGLTIAQSPETASFDSMPRSVIEARVASLVLSPLEIPGELERVLGSRSGMANRRVS